MLGRWAGQAEGAKLWLQVLTELKNRGVDDVFIVSIDGLKLPQSNRNGVFGSASATVHCASGAWIAELRFLETSQGSRRGIEEGTVSATSGRVLDSLQMQRFRFEGTYDYHLDLHHVGLIGNCEPSPRYVRPVVLQLHE